LYRVWSSFFAHRVANEQLTLDAVTFQAVPFWPNSGIDQAGPVKSGQAAWCAVIAVGDAGAAGAAGAPAKAAIAAIAAVHATRVERVIRVLQIGAASVWGGAYQALIALGPGPGPVSGSPAAEFQAGEGCQLISCRRIASARRLVAGAQFRACAVGPGRDPPRFAKTT
jgi:hypothetical protein